MGLHLGSLERCLCSIYEKSVKGQIKLKVLVNALHNDEEPSASSGGIYEKNYDKVDRENNGWGYQKWYKVRNDMRQQVTYPLYNFKTDYNTKIGKDSSILAWSFGDGISNGLPTDLDEKGNLSKDGEIFSNEYRRSYKE